MYGRDRLGVAVWLVGTRQYAVDSRDGHEAVVRRVGVTSAWSRSAECVPETLANSHGRSALDGERAWLRDSHSLDLEQMEGAKGRFAVAPGGAWIET